MISSTCKELCQACADRGIDVSPNTLKRQLLSILIHDSLMRIPAPKWGLLRRITLDSPMLCFSYPDLTVEQRREVLRSDSWIVEPKFYGCRTIICYHPDEGFTFWARSHDPKTYLPIELTDKIVLVKGDQISYPQDWIGKFQESFVLDAMIHSTVGLHRKIEDKYRGLEQNYVSMIVGSEPKDAIEYQLTRCPLTISAFDVLYFGNKAVWADKLKDRKSLLSEMFSKSIFELELPFHQTEYQTTDKIDYYRSVVEEGMEGVVFKNLESPYEPTTRRKRDGMVRLKQRMYHGYQEDLDAFLIGSKANPPGTLGSAFVSSLLLGVYLVDDDGVEREHILAEVSEIPVDIKIQISEQLPFNYDTSPTLKRQFHGKVVTFRGRGFDLRNMRFREASIDWIKGFRIDKDRFDCVIPRMKLATSVV